MTDTHKVVACLKQIGFKPSEKSFQDRLMLQKIVYLLTAKGVDTGVTYGLYVRGPYSPALTRDFFNNAREYAAQKTDYELPAKEKAIVEEFKQTFDLNPGTLEAAATYAYFIREKKLDSESATAALKKLKPFLTQAQIAVGTSRAKQFLFPPTREEIAEMKKEMQAWQDASDADFVKWENAEKRSVAR